MYTNAVAQATSGQTELQELEAFPASCSQRLKKADSLFANAVEGASPGQDVLRECEASRCVRRLKGGSDGLYSNAVVPGDDEDCEASTAVVSSPNMFANAVVQATAGRDVFRDTGTFYLVHSQELVSLQGEGVEEDLGVVVEDIGQVPWVLARAAIRRSNVAFAHVFPSFDLELQSSDNVEQLFAGLRNANTNADRSANEQTPCSNRSILLSMNAAKGTGRSALSGPRTPEIKQDRGQLSSTESVLSPEHQQESTCSPGAGELCRVPETCSLDGAATRANPSPTVPTKDQDKKRKRGYMPKVLDEKTKVSRAKKPRRAKAADDEDNHAASPPVLIPETRSPTLLQMKLLARHSKSQLKTGVHMNQRKPGVADTSNSKESQCAQATCEIDEPRLDISTQQIADENNDEGLRCTDLLLQRSGESIVPLVDLWSSNFVPLVEWNHGSSLGSESFIEACSNLPESEMSMDEVRNVLNRPLVCRNSASNFPAFPVPLEKNAPALDEDNPSTPRGPAFVSVCQDFMMLPSSLPPTPSPHWASDWDEDFSRIAATSTRRALNFDANAKEFRVEESESVVAEVRTERAGLIVPVSGIEESSQLPERALKGLELQVTDRESPVPLLFMTAPVPLAIDSTQVEELRIVPYDDGAKKMVVYKNRPLRKRRVIYKPRVDFKMLTLPGAVEDDNEQDKASWEQSGRQWQERARRFISIMRQVQGNRAFSRWKGSVVDSVGGALLTQNVSDFLSSNAFMALRARFPARHGVAKEVTEVNSTPLMTDQPPTEKEFSSRPRPERLTQVELKKQRKGEDQRQKSASERVAALLSKNVNQNICADEALADIVEALRIRLRKWRIEEWDHDADAMRRIEVRCSTTRFPQPCLGTGYPSMGAASTSGDHAPVTKSLPYTDVITSHSEENPPSKCSALCVIEGQECDSMEEARMSSSLVPLDEFQAVKILEPEQNRPKSVWTGELAVIHEKFASVVQECFDKLTSAGKEKVLATTLRHVLGKKKTSREEAANVRALGVVKLRPQRALARRRIDNYRYRQGNVSFSLLSGEARAAWEAGFVIQSLREKWEPIRTRILADEGSKDPWTEDCVDWEAVRRASVHDIADVIKNRGMNNALAGRMKAFLDQVHRDQDGSIDLEWIRRIPPEDAKAFLLSFRGVGLKSVECIRLLTLHHPSFPVDTNVGRIAVRLGWVPLQPLPEETQLHLLESYPLQAHIQQYIWPRICTLDQQTLYELHYQMITFGKVFCTKSKPNCNACPLRSECKHYASSYASARLLLKGPEKQGEKQPTGTALHGPGSTALVETTHDSTVTEDPCIPIIEEPRSPEPSPECSIEDIAIPDIEEVSFHVLGYNPRVQTQLRPPSLIIEELRSELDIKESFPDLNKDLVQDRLFELLSTGTDEDSLPVVELADDEVIEPTMNKMATLVNTDVLIEEIMDLSANSAFMALENTLEILDENLVVTDDFKHLPSQELILLPPQSAPAPMLKNVQRLRTVHFVYELPDNHPLLFEMDQREADDPCFYLLAIWSPDEVPATMPKINDDEASNPFAACDNNQSERTVRGTLLIPCKTAMRGAFPLNGTYFQVNEVFADHASSMQPIEVPRTLLWSLRRRFVYFSTAVSNLFRDMSQEEIQCCFQKGYVCLRAFDLTTRQPKALATRLHQSGAKIVRAPVSRKGQGRGRPRKDQTAVTSQPSTGEVAPPMETTGVLAPIGL